LLLPPALPARAPKPYNGRTLVVVTAHADDFTIFAGGTIIKMIDEG
jgi:LmbE family N-acetylglucosaminyl deacetylase